MDDLQHLNGVELEHTHLLTSSFSSSSLGPDPFSIGSEPWSVAEQAAAEIIRRVQGTVASDERRNKVIDYVQRLIRISLGCEVFPYGSVPLKTYLPDGDIDLTIFGGSTEDEVLAKDVCLVLEKEDQNPYSDCIVKDVQYIRAEVKIVKCLVQNVVVDISFNQLGGLCTLCFLEKVDRLIGKDHLFKRSIILIKAWCYYESRILGAHHGLISTYALETLVLYIFHRFHLSLNGPLAVLYKFLDYFSKFDWESFCVSLSGPLPLSSLPEITVERPQFCGSDLLLSDEFLKDCVEKFSVPVRGDETTSRIFIQKHLNIVDPLKENNNLGRSVSKGNFFRIRSAFSYGARKLGQILLKPQENMAEDISKFFMNTLDRHGSGLRHDVPDSLPVLRSDHISAPEMPPFLGAEPFGEYLDRSTTDYLPESEPMKSGIYEYGKKTDDNCASVIHLSNGSAGDVTSSGEGCKLANGLHNSLSSSSKSKLALLKMFHTPQFHSPGTLENENVEIGYQDDKHRPIQSSALVGDKVSQEGLQAHSCNSHESLTSTDLKHSSCSHAMDPGTSCEDPDCYGGSVCLNRPSVVASQYTECKKPLSDLCGDLNVHLDCLRCARLWFSQSGSTSTSLISSQNQQLRWVAEGSPWYHPMQYIEYKLPQNNLNNAVTLTTCYPPIKRPIGTRAAFSIDELPRTRGTGTYFPITNYQSYRTTSHPKGRSLGPSKSPRDNGRVAPFSDRNSHVKISRDLPHNIQQPPPPSPKGKAHKEVNGFIETTYNGVEYDLHGQLLPSDSTVSLESIRPSSSNIEFTSERTPMMNENRLTEQSYRLKAEDFPPLSSN